MSRSSDIAAAVADPERLAVLRRLALLDAPAEPSFDRLTRLATRLTGVPVSLVVLVDEHRQVFTSQFGLAEPWASRRETPLSHTFCTTVVATSAPVVVPDARQDGAVREHLAVEDLGVAAYAGIPLICDGQTVGSMCLIDDRPRHWSAEDLEVLGDLAEVATTELSLRLAVAEQQRAAVLIAAGEERYRSLVAAMSDGVLLRRADGTLEACNAAAERLLGLDAEQLAGRAPVDPRWRAIHEDGSEFPPQELPSLGTLRTGRPARGIVMGVHPPDGEPRWLSLSTEPLLREGDREPYAAVCCIADVTGRRRDDDRRLLQMREQEALRAVATIVAGATDAPSVFAAAAEHAATVFGANVSRVVRAEADGAGRLVGAWADATVGAPEIGGLVDRHDGTAIAEVLRTTAPVRIRARELRTDLPELRGVDRLRSGMGAPIEVDGRFWGAISVGWDLETPLGDEDSARLARFADLVSLAVTGAETREQLSQMAFTDHLTGLYNQRAFSDRLGEEVRRCHRYGRPLSLAILDLDHFKLVNDTHGHDAGDRALSEFAQRLLGMRRGSDVIARVGGEEFAWMLPETDGHAAMAAAERALRIVAGLPFAGVGALTTSIGVCSLEHAADARELYRHADLALYWAKGDGRNAAVRYTAESVARHPGGDGGRRLESAKTLAAVRALAKAVDAKDPSTQRHSERVAELAGELATVAGWAPAEVALLHSAALVHDVGKIGVPDTILLKPGRLDAREFELVQAHAALGAEMVADLLSPEQVDWIRHHHERHDGRGYPDGIAAEEIPAGARLLAIADAWDAMTVARPYARPRPVSEAIVEVRRGTGTQFSPDAVDALLALHDRGALQAGVLRGA